MDKGFSFLLKLFTALALAVCTSAAALGQGGRQEVQDGPRSFVRRRARKNCSAAVQALSFRASQAQGGSWGAIGVRR